MLTDTPLKKGLADSGGVLFLARNMIQIVQKANKLAGRNIRDRAPTEREMSHELVPVLLDRLRSQARLAVLQKGVARILERDMLGKDTAERLLGKKLARFNASRRQ
jgi:hypothetical protein